MSIDGKLLRIGKRFSRRHEFLVLKITMIGQIYPKIVHPSKLVTYNVQQTQWVSISSSSLATFALYNHVQPTTLPINFCPVALAPLCKEIQKVEERYPKTLRSPQKRLRPIVCKAHIEKESCEKCQWRCCSERSVCEAKKDIVIKLLKRCSSVFWDSRDWDL